ncbi:hypothetical protein [Melissospora conviva]|uniref:hypothetical protein n=1 Tax=Melissospora conviva TaxID=3388432 RepID=UPI003C1AC55C
MSAKRGDRAAPPPRPGGYTLRFATNESNPVPSPPTNRQHPLKGSLATSVHNGKMLPQWQYEVTGSGRIWYLPDLETRTCWIKHAGTGHPRATD